jgi:hypothetical protein
MIRKALCGYCTREFSYDDTQKRGKFCRRKCFFTMQKEFSQKMMEEKKIRMDMGWLDRVSKFVLEQWDKLKNVIEDIRKR